MRSAGFWSVVLAWTAVGCAPETAPPQWEFDSSIRALTVAPNGDIWWAGSAGLVGHHADGAWTLDTLRSPDGDTPVFRSIAVTDEAAFVLSIASPALLYRKMHTEATWSVVYTNTDSLAFLTACTFGTTGRALPWAIRWLMRCYHHPGRRATWSAVSCEDLPPAEEAAFAASNGNIALFGDEVWIASGGVASRIFARRIEGELGKWSRRPLCREGR